MKIIDHFYLLQMRIRHHDVGKCHSISGRQALVASSSLLHKQEENVKRRGKQNCCSHSKKRD
tara:strand:- start:1749 stop:1934 length:186 start_codon:yes stop_codon:yes gene_type:complete